MQPNSGKDCATCHLEWVEGFDKPGAVQLMDRPDRPVASASDTCLGCHDGSVADSRREVWIDHSHKTGQVPSAGMKVPPELPLEEGKLACRTCHTAHSGGGNGKGLKDTVFLRIKNDSGQLCKSCHGDHAQGPDAGSHPVGEMKVKLPEALAAAGSHAGADDRQVVCQTCHTAHGSRQDHLLVMGTSSSELCVTCHDQIRPGMFRNGQHEHPQNPLLQTAEQRQAIKDMGTKIGADGRMICLSCHRMHKGNSGRAMLADTLADSKLCIRCHPDRSDMVGSEHDLRKSAPDEKNAKGMTAAQSGPCGACHTFHSYARKPTPQNGDPQGLCTTCHADGKVAAKHSGMPFSHPGDLDKSRVPKDVKVALFDSKDDATKKQIACLSCHNPHEIKQKHFLRQSGDDLCANCHERKVREMAGPHDFSKKDYKNGRGKTVAETGRCGFCHAVHNANGPTMWVATASHPNSPDALCAECHRDGAIAGKHPVAKFNHPVGEKAVPKTKLDNLPLFNVAGHRTNDGSVTCATCHDPHAGQKQSEAMLRTADSTALCVQCHPNKGQMAGSLHDARASAKAWPGDAKKGELCLSCHKPHSNDEGKQRWAVAPAAGMDKDDSVCVGCHTDTARAEGDGPFKPGALVHPQTVLATSEAAKLNHGYPLKVGKNGGKDMIMCQTCHDPHSPPGPQHLLRVKAGQSAFEVCLGCHQEPKYVLKSMHSPELLNPDKPASHACLPCHATHAVNGSSRKLLWASKTFPRGRTESEKLCLGCHSPGGGAPVPTNFKHPETAMKKLTEATTQPTELQAKLAAIDQITCFTCHIPHGRELPLKEQGNKATRSRVAAAKPMLRADVDRQICATCHGVDATRVYLYFHDPAKRAAVKQMIGG